MFSIQFFTDKILKYITICEVLSISTFLRGGEVMELEVLYATSFTPIGVSIGGKRYREPIPCNCSFCPNLCRLPLGFCSKECLGGDESKIVLYGREFTILERSCTHIHSKCPVAGCNSKRAVDFIDSKTQELFRHNEMIPYPPPQPFCEKHLPKCHCGNPVQTTSTVEKELKYPLSDDDLKLFSSKCFKC
ncbi:MAG: hypothetical protein Harvfovirus3_43 [Harvfovirus sp.]|uniref:Uncharacterized protein n=1 Tax=Harvfovirus sp. TaxID=2487768 RepID=A0A3G5A090_9VIRU|nr:MAG: hypothetical protein Harvfovirus3_43 [Harvfovirus sp.]